MHVTEKRKGLDDLNSVDYIAFGFSILYDRSALDTAFVIRDVGIVSSTAPNLLLKPGRKLWHTIRGSGCGIRVRLVLC